MSCLISNVSLKTETNRLFWIQSSGSIPLIVTKDKRGYCGWRSSKHPNKQVCYDSQQEHHHFLENGNNQFHLMKRHKMDIAFLLPFHGVKPLRSINQSINQSFLPLLPPPPLPPPPSPRPIASAFCVAILGKTKSLLRLCIKVVLVLDLMKHRISVTDQTMFQ